MSPPHVAPSIRAVFFDAVGTLIFPTPGAPHVYAEHARRYGLEINPGTIRSRMAAAYAVEETADRAAGWVTSEDREVERWRRIVTASLAGVPSPDVCFRELFDHFARPDAWTVNPDASRVLAKFATRGLALGMASNYDRRLIPVIAGHSDLAEVRGRVVISSVVGRRKPSRHFFEAVVRVAGCQPAEVLFVGDDYENDYLAASAAGLTAVLFDERDRHPDATRVARLSELLG